jgi:hypothetical protein
MGAILFLVSTSIQSNPLDGIPKEYLKNPLVIFVCPDVDNPSYDYSIVCNGVICAGSTSDGYEMIMRENKGKYVQVWKETTCNRGGYQEPSPKYIM